MRDRCYVEGCKGEIVPSRDIRSTVARGGECDACGARYKSFGSGGWKFETERVPCPDESCDGFVEIEKRPGTVTAECWKCGTPFTRQQDTP